MGGNVVKSGRWLAQNIYPRGASGAVILSIIRTLITIFLLVSPFFCYQFTHKKRTLRRVNELLIINASLHSCTGSY